ncbi:MAG: SAM-dependent methyltransferase, partial [Pseudolabrys sp.]
MSSGSDIFDRRLLRVRQRRARRLTPATFLLDRVAAELGERLSAVLRKFDVAVDLGTPSDAVRRVLAANKNINIVVAAGLDGDDNGLHVTADEEALPFA